jgi:hypothetical protein
MEREWQARAVRAEAEAAALRVELARCRARLAAAERVVWATRSFPNALMMDALEAYDALYPPEAP